jgi:hypothetical protein
MQSRRNARRLRAAATLKSRFGCVEPPIDSVLLPGGPGHSTNGAVEWATFFAAPVNMTFRGDMTWSTPLSLYHTRRFIQHQTKKNKTPEVVDIQTVFLADESGGLWRRRTTSNGA